MTAAIWCAHPVRGSFVDVRVAILAYTLIALTLLVLVIRRGLRRCGPLSVLPWQDAATPRHRRRFMAYTTILLAGLAIMAVLFTALAALLIGHCQ